MRRAINEVLNILYKERTRHEDKIKREKEKEMRMYRKICIGELTHIIYMIKHMDELQTDEMPEQRRNEIECTTKDGVIKAMKTIQEFCDSRDELDDCRDGCPMCLNCQWTRVPNQWVVDE